MCCCAAGQIGIWRANTFPRGEGAPQGRMRNGDTFWYGTQSNKNVQPFRLYLFTSCIRIGTFRRSSSVTQIGSEVPIWATASPRGKRWRCRASASNTNLSVCLLKPITLIPIHLFPGQSRYTQIASPFSRGKGCFSISETAREIMRCALRRPQTARFPGSSRRWTGR